MSLVFFFSFFFVFENSSSKFVSPGIWDLSIRAAELRKRNSESHSQRRRRHLLHTISRTRRRGRGSRVSEATGGRASSAEVQTRQVNQATRRIWEFRDLPSWTDLHISKVRFFFLSLVSCLLFAAQGRTCNC